VKEEAMRKPLKINLEIFILAPADFVSLPTYKEIKVL